MFFAKRVIPLSLIFLTCVWGQTEDYTLSTNADEYARSTTPFPDDKFDPEKPEDLTVLEDLITSSIIYLNWTEPKKINGEIEGYRIFFLTNNLTDVQTVKAEDGEGMDHSKPIPLQYLKPFTHYRIWVKGFTRKNEGNSSAIVSARTDIAPPSAPDVLNITCKSPDTLYFKWARPEVYYNTIDYYDVFIKNDFDSSITEIQFNTSVDHLDFAALIPNLTIDTVYEVKVRASTYSTVHKNILKEGPYSDPKTILMHLECDKFHLIAKDSSVDANSVVFSSLGALVGGIFVACAIFILWRKCFHAAYYYLDDVPGQAPPTLMDWDAPPLENPPQDGPSRYAIPVSMFPRHVANLHADGDIGFSKEYESIQAESNQEDFASEQSQHPENKTKNRYLNIIAYDHTRVQLSPVPGHKKGYDYVNANYIDGFQCSRAYIGTQGPLPSTFDCFWRMIWEQRVTIIVMITNLVERGRRKCDLYWPKEGSETYGVIQVKLLREDVMATYTVRTLVIKHLRKKKGQVSEKIVFQYHYTNWPDHGTPDHPLPVLSFVKKSAAANPPGSGPIIVHCSAGVGRTGTYIVLDAMLKQIQKHGVVNIYGFLRHIRSQRNFLVQTEEQYIFIHDALLEAIESGETNVMRENLESYVESLRTENPKGDCSIQWHLLEEQYKLLTSFQPRDFNLVAANKNYNSHKNRADSNLPLEISRVHLTPKPGIDGSDYINATWLQGFQRLREFIITQHPLQETVFDFWQMIWDHSCQTIALLTLIDAQEYNIFWPTENCNIETANYRVKLVLEQELPACVARDFVMQSLTDDYELNVRILQCSGWPHFSQPQYDLFEFLKVVQESNCRNPNSPVVVIDRNGGTEAGTFCVLTALAMHLEYENFADVYMYAKLFHNKRPGVWRNSSDYLFLYSSIKCISPDTQLLPQHPQPINKPPITPEEPDSFPMTTLNGSTVGFQAATSDVEPEASIEIHQIISDVKDSPA